MYPVCTLYSNPPHPSKGGKINYSLPSVDSQPARYIVLAREICFLGLEVFWEWSDSYPSQERMRRGAAWLSSLDLRGCARDVRAPG